MPSTLLTAASGAPFPLASGDYWSGTGAQHPVGGVNLRLAKNASGNAYVGLSGGTTLNSGGFFLSGNNADGFVLHPGDSYFIPRLAFVSGQMNIYAHCDPACSGQARLYWENF